LSDAASYDRRGEAAWACGRSERLGFSPGGGSGPSMSSRVSRIRLRGRLSTATCMRCMAPCGGPTGPGKGWLRTTAPDTTARDGKHIPMPTSRRPAGSERGICVRCYPPTCSCTDTSRLQQMMPQARLRKASWMSSRISQRMRNRRNQCSSAKLCSTTQRCMPSPGTVLDVAPGYDRGDPDSPDLFAVLVVVVAAVGVDRVRSLSWPSSSATDGWDGLDQAHELGDVVAVSAGQRDRQRDAVRFGDQMVLGACSGTVDRARSGFGPPLSALTWEPSITALDQSSAPAAWRCHGSAEGTSASATAGPTPLAGHHRTRAARLAPARRQPPRRARLRCRLRDLLPLPPRLDRNALHTPPVPAQRPGHRRPHSPAYRAPASVLAPTRPALPRLTPFWNTVGADTR
jgi:hypothetical protein